MKTLVLAIALAAPAAPSGDPPAQGVEPPSYRAGEAPPRLAAGVQAADSAIAALQQRLSTRLMQELKQGGPARAVAVCRDEAPALTAETARAEGVRIGRTSHRLRNPGNEAPPWAARLVAAAGGRKAASVEPAVVDLGERVGVLRPIAMAAPCLQCHGPAGSVSPETTAFLKTAYPDDRAVGFQEGDLRGFFWAEAPVQRPPSEPAAVSSPGPSGDSARSTGERLLGEAYPRCTMCHSVAGKGNPKGPKLDGVGSRLSRDEIKAWIRTPREMAKKRGSTLKPAMAPYPEFSDEELEALVTYLASLEAKRPTR